MPTPTAAAMPLPSPTPTPLPTAYASVYASAYASVYASDYASACVYASAYAYTPTWHIATGHDRLDQQSVPVVHFRLLAVVHICNIYIIQYTNAHENITQQS